MIEQRLALPQRSPRPLSAPWICLAPPRSAAKEMATACSVSLWAWMPRFAPGTRAPTSRDDLLDLVRQRAAVGVAQHHPARAGLIRRFSAFQRVVGVVLETVEEMLAIDDHLAAGRHGGLDAVLDAFEVFLQRAAERDMDLIIPGFRDEDDGVGGAVEQGGDAGIVGGGAPGALGHAESGRTARFSRRVSRRKIRCPADWRRDSRPRHNRCRARRAGRRSASCRRAKNRRRWSARHRARWCRTGIRARGSLRRSRHGRQFFGHGGVAQRLRRRGTPCCVSAPT